MDYSRVQYYLALKSSRISSSRFSTSRLLSLGRVAPGVLHIAPGTWTAWWRPSKGVRVLEDAAEEFFGI